MMQKLQAGAVQANMVEGLVTVVIPAYNRSALIGRAVASCMAQTYAHLEVVVVDDGSSDDTPAVLAALEAKYGNERLRTVRQENRGSASARNRGMDMARGEFLQFLDSDDVLSPEKFAIQVGALRSDPEAEVAVCDYECVYDGEWDKPFEQVWNDGDIHRKLSAFWEGIVWISTPLIRRSRIPSALRWNAKVVPTEDTDFMFRLFLGIRKWCYTPGFLCTWIHHQGDRLTSRGPVSDLYYWELVDSVYQYWREARADIPRENWWMVPRWGYAILNEKGRHSRDRALLRHSASLALARPWSFSVFCLAVRMAIKSCLPWQALDVLVSLRRRL